MRRRILIVDDSPAHATNTMQCLRRLGFEVTWATSGLDGLKMARALRPDLVLLDVVMPDLDGLAVCRWLKLHARTRDIPVMMLTVRDAVDDRVSGLRLGADDYLPKPFDVKELEARIEAALRAKAVRTQLASRNAELQSMLDEMATLAHTDALTGLHNRRHFTDALAREVAVTHRYGRPLTCVMIDIDHFKALNDRHGHDGGDTALTTVGDILRCNLRTGDIASRYGGEEFALLLPHTEKAGATVVAQRIAKTLREQTLLLPTGALSLTASFGIADANDVASGDGGALVRAADAALYEAKRRGRDCIVVFDPTLGPARSNVA